MSDVIYSFAENIARVLIVPYAVFSVLVTVLVGMRFYVTRVVAKSPWTFDEYVAIVVLIANHIMLITEGISVEYGLGTDVNQIVELYPGGVSAFLKCILVLEIQSAIACPLSKMAVLAMFYRIFSASKMLRYSIWAITAMLVGWCIAVIMVSIPNIIFDILMVVLPIREVWALQMGREKKLAISGVFLLGGSLQGSTDGLYVNGNGAAKNEGGIHSENGIHVQRDVCVERSGKVTSRDVKVSDRKSNSTAAYSRSRRG
ncbi:hypothetical protein CCUS01_10342 [Colletotrichum cuscutae]|uniref:Rhodopsin domain-containing protein n=1 Tax=Colletotrichum cuscutae TaxID=1209917 RepID=A0AAI9XN23_9PEZI|nr:hypothetical protein CCUS01_10342 [Colletotrichum cuscutae]